MKTGNKKTQGRIRRHQKIRVKISGTSGCPRLAIFRSNRFIYAQLIDDVAQKTLGAASDILIKNKTKLDRAQFVGSEIARIAKEKKIAKVVFDRGGFSYRGRVKALAEKAREAGLTF